MKNRVNIINGIRDICFEISKGIASDKDIPLIANKYKTLLKEMDEAFHCIR